jgi:hypothetical protein
MSERKRYKLIAQIDIPAAAFKDNDDTIYVNITSEELENVEVEDKWVTREFNAYFEDTTIKAIAKVDEYIIVIDRDYMTGNFGIWVLKKLII